jgi:deoxyribodipyrimidine photo-lyase
MSFDLHPEADVFPPTDAALAARLAAIDPRVYARTRNALDGAVTRLSPYLTHGFIDVPEVVEQVRRRHPLALDDKLVFELAWREYFQHLWSRLGAGVFDSLRPPLPLRYATVLPEDIRTGATGVPAIDAAVRALYRSGYLHNHARMWLASYVVHLRKVHWRAGADWMVSHLLDGDLASNHLSWQWVAGTLTGKPYLFNAENVARHAPRWASAGSAIDRSYAELDRIARADIDVGAEPGVHPAVEEPARLGAPAETAEPPALAGAAIELLHPWSLRRRLPRRRAVALLLPEFHAAWPWPEKRWAFVQARLAELATATVCLPLPRAAAWLRGAEVAVTATLHPHYCELLAELARGGADVLPVPRLFDNPAQPCRSFSQFWSRVRGRRAN